MKNFYALLEAEENASGAEIRAAYRRLAKKYHPDANPDDKAAEARFKEIGEAYAVLGDGEKRKAYDKERQGDPQGKAPAGRAAPRKPASVDKEGMDALFKEYFAGTVSKGVSEKKSAGPMDANAAFEKFFGKR
jgi:DnaJ-class molecular chaperone